MITSPRRFFFLFAFLFSSPLFLIFSHIFGPSKICKYPQMKAESLHLEHILIVSFQVHCGGEESQNDEHLIIMDLHMLTCASICSAGFGTSIITILLFTLSPAGFLFFSELLLKLLSDTFKSDSWSCRYLSSSQ